MGVANDLVLYENALILAGPPNGAAGGDKMAYLQAPEIVKVGDCWKFVDLPAAIDPQQARRPGRRPRHAPLARSSARSPAARARVDPALQAALNALKAYDEKGGPDPAGRQQGPVSVALRPDRAPEEGCGARHHARRPSSSTPSRSSTAWRRSSKPATSPRRARRSTASSRRAARSAPYAALHKIQAVNSIESAEPGAKPEKVLAAYLDKLKGFLKDYPQADDRPDALFQIATLNEFDNEEKDARAYYAKLAEESPKSEFGKKAAGALRRLDLAGKPIDLTGKGINGEPMDASKFQGKPLLVLFWTSTADAGRRELPELAKVQAKHKDQGLEVLGVCLDTDKAAVQAYLKDNGLAWPQILEPKGMDGEVANQYGIISLPTMFLVDAGGKVRNRNIRSAAELDKLLDKSGAGDGAVGAALGEKAQR